MARTASCKLKMAAAQGTLAAAAEAHVGSAAAKRHERRDARELARLERDDRRHEREQHGQKADRQRRRGDVARQHAGELGEEREREGHEGGSQRESHGESRQAHARVLDDQHAAQRAVRQAEGLERAVVGVALLDGGRHRVRADDERYREQKQREHAHDGAPDDHHHHRIADERVGGEHPRSGVRPGDLLRDDPGKVGRGRAGRARLVRQAHVDLGHAVRGELRLGREQLLRLAVESRRGVHLGGHLVEGSRRHHVALDLHERGAHLGILVETRDGEAPRRVPHDHLELVAFADTGRRLHRHGHVHLVGPGLGHLVDEAHAVFGEQAEIKRIAPGHKRCSRRGVLVDGRAVPPVVLYGNAQSVVQARLGNLGQRLDLGGHLAVEVRRRVDGVHVARLYLGKGRLLAGVQVHVHARREREHGAREGHEQEDAEERPTAALEAGRDQRAHERHSVHPPYQASDDSQAFTWASRALR